MSDTVETVTVRIETDDSTDEVTLPADFVSLLAVNDQSPAETIGDLVLQSVAGHAHHLVHHGHGEEPEDIDLEAQEAAAMELFEERFGLTYGEATGHQH